MAICPDASHYTLIKILRITCSSENCTGQGSAQYRGNILGLAACLLRRDTILKYRFDPLYSLLDDSELIRNLSKDKHKFGVSSTFVYHHHKADLKGYAKQRFINGRGKAQYLGKYGLLHPTMWSPLLAVYMLGYSVVKGKLNLFPYFFVGGVVETAGMFKGFYELTVKKINKKNPPKQK